MEIFLSPFSFGVTLFTVGGDLPVTVRFEVTLFTVGGDLPVTV